jgi:hypothetical protein
MLVGIRFGSLEQMLSGRRESAMEECPAMILTQNPLIVELLVRALFLFFLVAGIAGAALGLSLILSPGLAFQLLDPMNRWVSGSKTLAPLEAVHNIDPAIYKYRRWFSAVFIVGTAFSMFMIVAKFDIRVFSSMIGTARYSVIGPWLIESLKWLMIAGSVLALVIGIVLGFFPNALSVVEKRANQWYVPRQLGHGANKMHLLIDRWVQHSPKTAGWIIVIGALIVIVNSAVVLLGRY